MTANEAKLLSAENYRTPIEAEMDIIYDEVAIAAQAGFFHVPMKLLSNKAAEMLKKEGYELENRKDCVIIRWE